MSILDKLGIDISKTSKEERGFFRGIITEYESYIKKINQPEIQEYFHTLIAAIMLEYHKAYETFDIKVPYRIKSPKSIFDKILEYMTREDKSEFSINQNGELQGELKEELSDVLAITIVGCNRPSTFYSKDAEINNLIDEKRCNQVLLGELQKLRLQITKKEFSGTEKNIYNFQCSRKDYYMMCIMTIERIKSLIHPNAINLLQYYDDFIERIRNRVPERFFDICLKRIKEEEKPDTIEKFAESIRSLNVLFRYANLSNEEEQFLKDNIDEKDIETSNFLDLNDDFSARIYDKLDLAVLSRQVDSVFENSEVLKKFGVSFDKEKIKEKRTENGYVANFIYLNTPFGIIEMQLQTQHENQEGNYGYAAHSSLEGKKFKEFELPNLDNKDEMRDFRICVDFVTPKKFLAQFDHLVSDRIVIQKFGTYQNYKALTSQVEKGSNDDKRLKKYFSILYSKKAQYFPDENKNESVEGFIPYDIEEYLNRKDFLKIMNTGNKEEANNIEK